MDTDNNRLSNNPIIVAIGLIASLIAIFVFATGYENIKQITANPSPTPSTALTQTPAPTTLNSIELPSQSESLESSVVPLKWEFNTDGDPETWGIREHDTTNIASLKVENGLLIFTSLSDDPQINSEDTLAIDTKIYKIIEIKMRISRGRYGQLFFSTTLKPDKYEELSKSFIVYSGSEFRVYTLEMINVSTWEGIVTQLRIDPTDALGLVEIDYIRLR